MKNATSAALFLGGLLSFATASLAQQATPAAPPTPTPTVTLDAAPANDPNEVVCRPGTAPVGTRFPGPRMCHTRKEWAQIQRDAQDALIHQQMERSSSGN